MRWLLPILIACATPAMAQPDNAPDGAAVFQRCAACHTASGVGVPGAFPPLGREFRTLAASDAGRRWLVLVVINGLAGPIVAEGGHYAGYMPAQTRDPAEIAAVLNHVGSVVAHEGPPFRRFGSDEVKRWLGDTASPAGLGAEHAKLVP